jgi:hypothetical protein
MHPLRKGIHPVKNRRVAGLSAKVGARPIGRTASVQSQEYRTGAEGLARFAVRGIVMGSITRAQLRAN